MTLAEATSDVVTFLRRDFGNGEAAQFPSAFQQERGVNRFIESHLGHSPSSIEALTHIPNELRVTTLGEPVVITDGTFKIKPRPSMYPEHVCR